MTTLSQPNVLKLLPRQRDWTRAEFERLAEIGLFANEKLELIEGVIVEKMTQNLPHIIALHATLDILRRIFGNGYAVLVQSPLVLGDRSRPEPDLAVIEGNLRDLANPPSTALLVVEVSDTTLDTDRTIKASLYARSGIADYWIINVTDRVVEIYRQPAAMESEPLGFGYRSIQRFTDEQNIAALAAPDSMISVADLLP